MRRCYVLCAELRAKHRKREIAFERTRASQSTETLHGNLCYSAYKSCFHVVWLVNQTPPLLPYLDANCATRSTKIL